MKHRLFVDASFDTNMGTEAAGACFFWSTQGEVKFESMYSFKCDDGNEAEFRALRRACKTIQRVLNNGDSVIVYLDSDDTVRRAKRSDNWWLRNVELKLVKSHKAGNEISMGNNHVDKKAKEKMRELRDEILRYRLAS